MWVVKKVTMINVINQNEHGSLATHASSQVWPSC
jgi:hypothetical protein